MRDFCHYNEVCVVSHTILILSGLHCIIICWNSLSPKEKWYSCSWDIMNISKIVEETKLSREYTAKQREGEMNFCISH
jgi:hypothetical protein